MEGKELANYYCSIPHVECPTCHKSMYIEYEPQTCNCGRKWVHHLSLSRRTDMLVNRYIMSHEGLPSHVFMGYEEYSLAKSLPDYRHADIDTFRGLKIIEVRVKEFLMVADGIKENIK